MAREARLSSVVTFVQELDRSVGFYTEVLGLDVADRDTTAALLVSETGTELILRAMGDNAPHPLGGVGVQYVVWTAADRDDLDRCEQVLKQRQAYTRQPQHGRRDRHRGPRPGRHRGHDHSPRAGQEARAPAPAAHLRLVGPGRAR